VQQFLDHAGITVHIENRPCYHLMGAGRRLELRGSLITNPLPPDEQPTEPGEDKP
jgi:hypothetical protein